MILLFFTIIVFAYIVINKMANNNKVIILFIFYIFSSHTKCVLKTEIKQLNATRYNITTLCWAKDIRCESSHVTALYNALNNELNAHVS